MTEYRNVSPEDTSKILTGELRFTREDVDAMMYDARANFTRNNGVLVTRTAPSGDRVTLERHPSFLYTVKVYEKPIVHPQFYVFRVKTPGYLPVWCEYMNGDVHTVLPLPYKRKRDAVNALNVMHPDAYVDTLCDIADKRYARRYVAAGWSGRQIPELQYGDIIECPHPPNAVSPLNSVHDFCYDCETEIPTRGGSCIHVGTFSDGNPTTRCWTCDTDVPRSEL